MNLKEVRDKVNELKSLEKELEAQEKAKKDLISSLDKDVKAKVKRLDVIDDEQDKLKTERSDIINSVKENLTGEQLDLLGITIRKGRATDGESKVGRVRKYIAENPGSSNKDIQDALGEDAKSLHSAFWQIDKLGSGYEKRDGKYYLA